MHVIGVVRAHAASAWPYGLYVRSHVQSHVHVRVSAHRLTLSKLGVCIFVRLSTLVLTYAPTHPRTSLRIYIRIHVLMYISSTTIIQNIMCTYMYVYVCL